VVTGRVEAGLSTYPQRDWPIRWVHHVYRYGGNHHDALDGLCEVNYKDMKGVALINFVRRCQCPGRFPVENPEELQDYAKANAGKLKASGTGKGGI